MQTQYQEKAPTNQMHGQWGHKTWQGFRLEPCLGAPELHYHKRSGFCQSEKAPFLGKKKAELVTPNLSLISSEYRL
jgi:hypothetical protein